MGRGIGGVWAALEAAKGLSPKERCVASPSPPHPPRMLFYNMFLWVSGRARCPRHLVYLQSKFKICAARPIQGTPRSVAISGQAARVRSPFLGLLVAMSHGAEGGASDWLGESPPDVLAAAVAQPQAAGAAQGAAPAAQPRAAGAEQHAVPPPVGDAAQQQAAGAAHHAVPAAQPQAAGAAQHAVPPPVVLPEAAAAGAAQPQAGGIGGARPASEVQQLRDSDAVVAWILQERPYLQNVVVSTDEGRQRLPMDAVLALGEHGSTILHLMIDGLRSEARFAAVGKPAIHAVPWRAILALPGVSQFANAPVATGRSEGKTPLCYLAAQCMPGDLYRDACHAICTWLLDANAAANLASCPAKCPLMLAAGSGNADFVELLLNARASLEVNEGGPSPDAVLSAVTNTKGDGPNQARMLRCLQSRGYMVPPLWQGGGTASRRSSSAAVTRHASTAANAGDLWANYQYGVAQAAMKRGGVPGLGAASTFPASAGAAPAQQGTTWGPGDSRGSSSSAAARMPLGPVAAPAAAAPAVAAPAIAALPVAAPGAAAPAVAVKAPPPNAAAAPQPPPAAPMAAPAPQPPPAAPMAAAAPGQWWTAAEPWAAEPWAGGGDWAHSASHAQAAGGGGGWATTRMGSSTSHPSWWWEGGATGEWTWSSSGARPNADADARWWWNRRYYAWMYSPRDVSHAEGRWAWSACRRFAVWFVPPTWTLTPPL